MITRYSAWMDGAALHDIDPTIYVMDIAESAPTVNTLSAACGTGDGMRIISRRRQTIAVAVRVMVHEYDPAKRKAIFGKIAAWATGGKYLTIGDRPEQRLRVHCDTPPVTGSALRWTNTANITFTAYETPYWEDDTPTTQSKTGANGSMTLSVPGNAGKTTVDVTMENTGTDTITDFAIAVNDTQFVFSGLSVAAGETLKIAYDDDGILQLPAQNRTPESSDDLLAVCGTNNAVSYTANASVTVTVSARGRWL